MSFEDEQALVCRMPTTNERDALELLESVAGGGGVGAGVRSYRMGVNLPAIRAAYEAEVAKLVKEIELRKAQRMPAKELAEWAVRERTRIARSIRMKQGIGAAVVLEVRDQAKYGLGGRTPENLFRRYQEPGLPNARVWERMTQGAKHPQSELTERIVKGARFLKHGGRVVVVVSVAITAHKLLTAPPEELEKALYEEAGAAVGGSAGAGTAVGLCLLFGVATGGWGLLACGVVGGAAGGLGGTLLGEKLYYTLNDDAISQADATGVVDPDLLHQNMVCK